MSKKLLKYNEFRNDIFESVIKRGKDHDMFNYSYVLNDMWKPIINEAQDFQSINFDLENNDGMEKKTILIDQLLRKDQPVKTEVNLELCRAGGDWEHPVLYFKVEFTHDHFIHMNGNSKDPDYVWDRKSDERPDGARHTGKYCIIPGTDINYLKETEGGHTAYTDETIKEDGLDSKDMKIDDKMFKKAWKWIEDLIHRLSESRHKMLDEAVDHLKVSVMINEGIYQEHNVGIIHKDCANKRQEEWQEANKDLVVSAGDYIKMEFTNDVDDEHMFVEVTDVEDQENFKGTLANDPKFLKMKFGDEVSFTRSQIEQHLPKKIK